MDTPRVESKIDAIQSDITEIKVTLAVNTESLKQHMRRSEALEALVLPLDARMKAINGVLKFIGFLAVVTGLVEAVVKVLK